MSDPSNKHSVTCVITTFNRAGFILDAIKSVQMQTHRVDEIIVVDDGSTDDTSSVTRAIDDPRIRYTYQPNSGISKARNRGIRLSSGSVIAFLDSDDVWYPAKLAKQLSCLSHGGYGLVYCAKSWIDATGADIANPYPQSEFPQGNVFRELFRSNFITSASCVIARRECFDTVGMFMETAEFASGEDYEMWLRIARSYPAGAVPEELVKYRTHNANQTRARPRRYRGTLAALYKAIELDPERTLVPEKEYRARLRQVYSLAVNEMFYGEDLKACKTFGYEALSRALVSPSLLLFTLLAHLPPTLLRQARRIYPW